MFVTEKASHELYELYEETKEPTTIAVIANLFVR